MSQARLILERQGLHVSLLVALLLGVIWASQEPAVRAGGMWGAATPVWFWLAIALPIAHQGFVWFCWRTELHAAWMTRTFGKAAFPLYAVGFSVLGIARVLAVLALAISNRHTVSVDPIVLKLLALVVAIPAVYLFYSVGRYFGFKRAFGIDHFDAAYRSLPFVRQGIFRFTRNGMYVYGFLILWVPALWFGSRAALVAALFNHLYIWVHYHATELPDMRRIYAKA